MTNHFKKNHTLRKGKSPTDKFEHAICLEHNRKAHP